MGVVNTYLLGATFQALGGLLTHVLFFRYRRRLPEGPLFAATAAFILIWTWSCLQLVPLDPSLNLLWGFLPFLTASFFFAPALYQMGSHLVCQVFASVTRVAPESRKRPYRPRRRPGWADIRRLHLALRETPRDTELRESLIELYLSMAYFDSALAELQRLSELLPRGYDHARILHKAAFVIIEKKKQPAEALSWLRRILRLYPRSYFAAYARRWINHCESRSAQ